MIDNSMNTNNCFEMVMIVNDQHCQPWAVIRDGFRLIVNYVQMMVAVRLSHDFHLS